ncbi:tetratricopeptide repeat protein [Piscinibacter sp. HJYY11]|uniref:tetratricopeptide repeat protein n=1 Tax=Piscinibacter sp. HJYY11 TaxID=2801333 RepID=UPI00191FDD7C|nr:tetratricopeptide repeat protein [Piscinibacter sp. HJYY11]MBL0726181.1 tetratricopeptide repeat protein [Piscinibacter sp. HJYY11]
MNIVAAIPVLAQAQQLLATGRHAEGEALLRPLLRVSALRGEVNHLLSIAAQMTKRLDEGLAHARQAVAAAPEEARFHFVLGRAYKALAQVDEAEAAYREALRLQPRYVDALVSLGIVRKLRGDLGGAVALYDRALELDASCAAAHANKAAALALQTALSAENGADDPPGDEIIEAQARAVQLDPHNPVLLRNQGALLLRARRRVEAAQALNQSLTHDPSNVEACLNLAFCLRALGDAKLAIQAFEKWLQHNRPDAAVMRALAGLLTREGRVDEALSWAGQAATLDPDPYALVQLGSTLLQCRRVEEALVHCQRAVALSGGRAELYPTLLLGTTYWHEDPQPVFEAHTAFGRTLKRAEPRPAWAPLAPGERLRVGYVSGDFVRHSVSYFIGPLLEHHDRSRFDVTCYHNLAWGDAVTERFKSYGHRWVECEGLTDDQLRRRVVADGIHILVDLAGHTTNSRVFMFALGAAPVQVSYLGYPTISGVPAIDFRITDAVIDPGDMPPLESEKPLCLPRTMFCYRPDEAPEIAPPPYLRRGHVTFGSFNNIAKVTDHTLELWAAVMNAVPGSRLLLKSSSMAQAGNRRNIESFMAQRRISADRLDLRAWIAGKASHLELYNEVDVALDPYPYNGATTTCEALWMGVPVVSRRGRTHTSRMGASILGAIGRGEWVADSDQAYVATAVRLANDAESLAQWRDGARRHLASGPLFHEKGFTRDIEAALMKAWSLAGQAG